MISIRWLVVRAAAPLRHLPPGMAQAQPPGPGLPRQAPSVYTVVSSTALACQFARHASSMAVHRRRWLRSASQPNPSSGGMHETNVTVCFAVLLPESPHLARRCKA